MVRKQVYLEPQQEQKVKRLARALACTEADIIRQAIERLPDPARSVEERLRAAGILAPPPADPDMPCGLEEAEVERQLEEWVTSTGPPLGLSGAVIEGRC